MKVKSIKISFNKDFGKIVLLFLISIFIFNACKQQAKDETKKNNTVKKDSIVKNNQPKPIPFDTTEFIKSSRNYGKFLILSTDILKKGDFKYMSPSDLRIARNEIFARYGYIFHSEDLKKYFSQFDWYKPIFKNVQKYLTDIEIRNIDSLLKYEKINPNIEPQAQFDTLLSLLRTNKDIPLLLEYKYNCNSTDLAPFTVIDTILFDFTEKYKYLLYCNYDGCDQCDYYYMILKYSIDGKLLDTYDLGGPLDTIIYPHKNICEITITSNDYGDFEDENYESHTDTVLYTITLDKNENISVKEN